MKLLSTAGDAINMELDLGSGTRSGDSYLCALPVAILAVVSQSHHYGNRAL